MIPELVVHTASPIPPYEQIRAQLDTLISNGVLQAGQRLPPVRQLAADLSLAVGTVARAYRELELTGHVYTRRGGGTRVAEAPASTDPAERRRELDGHAAGYVGAARRLGASDSEAVAAIHRAVAAAGLESSSAAQGRRLG